MVIIPAHGVVGKRRGRVRKWKWRAINWSHCLNVLVRQQMFVFVEGICDHITDVLLIRQSPLRTTALAFFTLWLLSRKDACRVMANPPAAMMKTVADWPCRNNTLRIVILLIISTTIPSLLYVWEVLFNGCAFCALWSTLHKFGCCRRIKKNPNPLIISVYFSLIRVLHTYKVPVYHTIQESYSHECTYLLPPVRQGSVISKLHRGSETQQDKGICLESHRESVQQIKSEFPEFQAVAVVGTCFQYRNTNKHGKYQQMKLFFVNIYEVCACLSFSYFCILLLMGADCATFALDWGK